LGKDARGETKTNPGGFAKSNNDGYCVESGSQLTEGQGLIAHKKSKDDPCEEAPGAKIGSVVSDGLSPFKGKRKGKFGHHGTWGIENEAGGERISKRELANHHT